MSPGAQMEGRDKASPLLSGSGEDAGSTRNVEKQGNMKKKSILEAYQNTLYLCQVLHFIKLSVEAITNVFHTRRLRFKEIPSATSCTD